MTKPYTDYLIPNWPAPINVHAYTTTRQSGYSKAPFASFNLADHVGDDLKAVNLNRQQLKAELKLQHSPVWLKQIHSNIAVKIDNQSTDIIADASYTTEPHTACVVLTADCLPVLICNHAGTQVAAIHAGWRGLANGVIQNTVRQLTAPPDDLLVWLGPAIGPDAFEVGAEVREQFTQLNPLMVNAFKPSTQDRYLADIYHLAKIILQSLGINAVYGQTLCTYSDPECFYSYRRDGETGRMASLIWLE